MAALTSRQDLHDYVLRRLGYPVIDINVDPEQVEDRIDDALQKYRDYHYDGTRHIYYKILVTQEDIDAQEFTIPNDIIGITRVFRIGGASVGANNLFNLRYQIHLNDLFNFASANITPYVMAMRHIETIEEVFVGQQPIRFSRHTNKLNVDMDWTGGDVKVNDFVILDCYRVIDPEEFNDVYDDIWLKKYTTALVKKQWAQHLSKFSGVQLPGGNTLDGTRMLQEAEDEIQRMDREMIMDYSLPVHDMVG
jgi:hypothetical protein